MHSKGEYVKYFFNNMFKNYFLFILSISFQKNDVCRYCRCLFAARISIIFVFFRH